MTPRRLAALAAAALVPVALVAAGGTAAPASAVPASTGSASTGSANVISAYSLAAPRGTAPSGLVVRAVIPAGAPCPDLLVTVASGAKSVPMSVRRAPRTTGAAFDPITVCSAHMPVGATAASVGGRTVPARMPERVSRLAVFSDSGCRISSNQVQDCASTTAWPLAIISSAMARSRPDAVLFAGDFFYREAACPSGDQDECGSSPSPLDNAPFTDSAYGWIADVLLPMTPMLSTTPFIASRGNHEACYRAGNGYFLLIDPRDGTEGTCAPVLASGTLTAAPTNPTPTYAIDLPVGPGRTLRLAIVDSAGGDDTSVTSFAAVQRVSFEQAAALTRPRPGRESWLVTHRPIYGLVTTEYASPGKPFSPWTSADQTAAAAGLLGNYSLLVSSHVHIAQAVRLPGLPGQLVLGNGGTLLDPGTGYPLPTTTPGLGYPQPDFAWVSATFGYAIATPNADAGSWTFSMRGIDAGQFARCGVADASIYCVDTP